MLQGNFLAGYSVGIISECMAFGYVGRAPVKQPCHGSVAVSEVEGLFLSSHILFMFLLVC